jgi:hypothetical protein
MIATATETSLVSTILEQERRDTPRLGIAKRVLACPVGPEYKEEVQTTSNISRNGLYFETRSKHYRVGMPISVVEHYSPETRYNSPSFGKVVRVDDLADGSSGVAVQILMR